MNWVGGTRNRMKVKNEKKKQTEFFEKQKYARRMKMYSKLGEQKLASKPSLDLVSLEMAALTAKQFQNKHSKNKEQRNKVNIERCTYSNTARLPRHHNVELPMSPNATPSILQLGDDINCNPQEPQPSSNLHNFRRDVQVSMFHSQQTSQGSKHLTHAPPVSSHEKPVLAVAREEFSCLNQPLVHIKEKYSEDVFFHFPSSSKDTTGHHGDSLPSHQSQYHGVSSSQMSISSDTSEDSSDAFPNLLVKQDPMEVIHLDSNLEKKLLQRTSPVSNAHNQYKNNSSSSLENFRRHFRTESHIEGPSGAQSPLICLETSTESSPTVPTQHSSVGSADLLCHESTNFTSPESVCNHRMEGKEKFGEEQIHVQLLGSRNDGQASLGKDLPDRWHAMGTSTDQQSGIKTTLEWKSICEGCVPKEPRSFCGDVPSVDGQHVYGSLPQQRKKNDLSYEGSSFTRAVLKEVLDLDAELNKHTSQDDESRPFKKQKMLQHSVESFSSNVPTEFSEASNLTKTELSEDIKSLMHHKNTPPLSPFTRDVQRRAVESIASLTPIKRMAKLRDVLKHENKICAIEQSDSDIAVQGESSNISTGQTYPEDAPKDSPVIMSSAIYHDREIQCQIAPVQPSKKDQSTQICSSPNSGLKKDAEIQTDDEPLQNNACTQYESQPQVEAPCKETQHSDNVCDGIKPDKTLISNDGDETGFKKIETSPSSKKLDESSLHGMKRGNCAPTVAEGKLNLEAEGQSIELLSQSTYTDSFDSFKSI